MQIDLLCPVENQGVTVKTNSKSGEPYALFKLFNLSEQVVERVVFTVHAYDAYGSELGVIPMDFDGLNGEPKNYFAANKAVSLSEFSEAKHITVDFQEVHFAEGEPYIKAGEPMEITVTEPDYDEKIRLMSAAGDDAVCYTKDAGTYWLCVCGRPNANEATECVRCGRNKAEAMAKYSSRDALNKTIAELEEQQRKEEEAKRLAEEQAKEERSAKRKKTALFTAIGIVAVAILCVIGFFVYGAVMTGMGNSAAKAGEFTKAYGYYAAAGKSEKIAEISENVRGNSNVNIMMLGMVASDEENLYYIDPAFALYKENKATGEKEQISDVKAVMLSALDGWIYYLNPTTGQQLCRVSTDGMTKEIVYELEEGYFSVANLVGNELYFISQEPIKDLTPEMQEQIAAGQMNDYRSRLYRLTVGKKKPELVSEMDITELFYYKDKFYFVNQADGCIYSMNRDGGEVTKLVSGPVMGLELHNDSLYYLDGTPDETTGIPKFALIRAQLDGAYAEDVVADKLAVVFCFDGDDLYYLQQELDGNSKLYKRTGTEEILLAEGCQQFNVKDGNVVYIDARGLFMKGKADGSGFEEVEFEMPAAPETAAPAEPQAEAPATTEAPAAE